MSETRTAAAIEQEMEREARHALYGPHTRSGQARRITPDHPMYGWEPTSVIKARNRKDWWTDWDAIAWFPIGQSISVGHPFTVNLRITLT